MIIHVREWIRVCKAKVARLSSQVWVDDDLGWGMQACKYANLVQASVCFGPSLSVVLTTETRKTKLKLRYFFKEGETKCQPATLFTLATCQSKGAA